MAPVLSLPTTRLLTRFGTDSTVTVGVGVGMGMVAIISCVAIARKLVRRHRSASCDETSNTSNTSETSETSDSSQYSDREESSSDSNVDVPETPPKRLERQPSNPILPVQSSEGSKLPPFLQNIETHVKHGVPEHLLPPQPPKFSSAAKDEPFGRAFGRMYFMTDPSYTFLNHGSYGATLRVSWEAMNHWKACMEANPANFIEHQLMPQLAHTYRALADYVNCSPKDLTFVRNTTSGVSAIVSNIKLTNADSVMILTTTYPAVKNSLKAVCHETGAELIEVPLRFPLSSGSVLEDIEDHVKPSTRFAIIDHMTSSTACILPLKRIVQMLHSKGVLVCVDGAHALGHLPLDVTDIDADFYISNAHKWLCSSKGGAMLYVKAIHQQSIRPLTTSHGHSHGFQCAFAWAGTADYTPYLAICSALQFREVIGDGRIAQYTRSLAEWVSQYLSERFNTVSDISTDPHMMGNMAVVKLPDTFMEKVKMTAIELENHLRTHHKMMTYIFERNGCIYARLSAHIYNEKSDYERFGDAVEELVSSMDTSPCREGEK
eukprot:GFYU01005293.1.p1 GENE.GFYU01005293.1~~GFYU01005293.1.p1  ORF type:complete len:547 (+),score=63.18 GFYU01005293.1:231-1871(+)